MGLFQMQWQVKNQESEIQNQLRYPRDLFLSDGVTLTDTLRAQTKLPFHKGRQGRNGSRRGRQSGETALISWFLLAQSIRHRSLGCWPLKRSRAHGSQPFHPVSPNLMQKGAEATRTHTKLRKHTNNKDDRRRKAALGTCI